MSGEVTAFEQVTRQKVENLENWLRKHEQNQNGSLEKIYERLEGIEKSVNGRPSWAVSIMLTLLSSLSVGLIVYVVSHPGVTQ